MSIHRHATKEKKEKITELNYLSIQPRVLSGVCATMAKQRSLQMNSQDFYFLFGGQVQEKTHIQLQAHRGERVKQK